MITDRGVAIARLQVLLAELSPEDRAELGEGTGWYTVSGIIINDAHGPKRWCENYEALTPAVAEDMARKDVHDMLSDGLHGVLLVANVFEGKLRPKDSYACYADDPTRAPGYPPEFGWSPPKGFEGLR